MTMLTIRAMLGFTLIAVSLVGVLLACILNVKGARGRKERAFVTVSSFALIVLIALLLVLMVYLKSPYNYLTLVSYLIVLPFAVYRISLRRQLIRELERRAKGMDV